MPETKLGSQLYPIFDRTYMAFGSLCNACQSIMTEKNKEEIAEWAWNFAKTKTEELLNELYAKNEPVSNGQELPL